MIRTHFRTGFAGLFCSLVLQFLAFSSVSAQAWVPAKKEGVVSLTYQRVAVERHLFSTDVGGSGNPKSFDLGDIDSNTEFLGLDYGLTSKLAVSGSVAYVSSKYNGAFAENPATDDGSYHGALQDFRAEMRYLAAIKPLAVTPFVGVVVPSHNYETFGHVSVGQNLKQYLGGVSLGRIWNPYVHTTYLQATTSYSFFEKHMEHSIKRSNAYLEAGTYVTKSLSLRALGSWQRTHGGLDWATDLNTDEDFHMHDALSKSHYYGAGAGVTFAVTPWVEISATWSKILRGENTHDARALTFGTSWSFGSGSPPALASLRSSPLASIE